MADTVTIEGLRMPADAIIDGASTMPSGFFENVTPRDGSVIGRVALCSPADVDRAVASARAAFENGRWRDLPYSDKKAVLFGLADLMEANLEELATLESLDMGKPVADARAFDIPASIKTFRYYAEALDKLYGEVGPHHPGRISWVQHEPLGVIGCDRAVELPAQHGGVEGRARALAMGNSVVLKPAEQSPLTAIRLGELALEAGLPAGVLNVIPGTGEVTGQALAKHMDVDMIAFTGSGPVGGLLMRYAGESNLKRVSLELGGKSPQIVFADCPDMEGGGAGGGVGDLLQPGRGLHRWFAAARPERHQDGFPRPRSRDREGHRAGRSARSRDPLRRDGERGADARRAPPHRSRQGGRRQAAARRSSRA